MYFLIVTFLTLATVAVSTAQEPPKATSRVNVNGDHFIIPEAKASFRIPKQWLIWKRFFCLDSTQLSTVQNTAAAEWDSAYGPITDAILPFADCLLHIGNDGWGAQGAARVDVHLRAYLTDTKPEEITKAVADTGVETAGKVKGRSVKSDSRDDGGWRIDHVGFDLWYSDYGGRAGVDFYSRPCGAKTLVLVFMLGDDESTIKDRDSIIGSFKMEK